MALVKMTHTDRQAAEREEQALKERKEAREAAAAEVERTVEQNKAYRESIGQTDGKFVSARAKGEQTNVAGEVVRERRPRRSEAKPE